MSILKKAVLGAFDTLADELRAYDQDSKQGGACLLWCGEFNQAAKENISATERDRAALAAKGIHQLMKGTCLWVEWAHGDYRRGKYQTAGAVLDVALTGARQAIKDCAHQELALAVVKTEKRTIQYQDAMRVVETLRQVRRVRDGLRPK